MLWGLGLGWLGDAPSQGLDLEDTNAGNDGTIVTMEGANEDSCIQKGCNIEEILCIVKVFVFSWEDLYCIVHHFDLEFVIIVVGVIAPKVIDS